jgi:membrane protein required for colicin V production
MTLVDYVIAFLCVLSGVIGLWRGFVKEALSLVALLAAIWLAWRFAPFIDPLLGEWSGAPEARIWVARVVIVVLVLIAGAAAAWLARTLVRHSGLSGVDRLLGMAFGLLRGVVIVGLAVMALEFLGLDQAGWWQEARLRPYAETVATAVRYYAELGNRYLQGQASFEDVVHRAFGVVSL